MEMYLMLILHACYITGSECLSVLDFFFLVYIYIHFSRPLLETWLLFDYLLLFEEIQYAVLALQIASLCPLPSLSPPQPPVHPRT